MLTHFRGNLERVNNLADALHDSINQVREPGSKIVEVCGKDEIADSVDQGTEVTVFVLYRLFHVGDETHDFVDSVSPHPFPQFLSASSTSCESRKHMSWALVVIGSSGFNPYATVEDFTRTPYSHDQPVMRGSCQRRSESTSVGRNENASGRRGSGNRGLTSGRGSARGISPSLLQRISNVVEQRAESLIRRLAAVDRR